jgi:hypothetical protein
LRLRIVDSHEFELLVARPRLGKRRAFGRRLCPRTEARFAGDREPALDQARRLGALTIGA